MPKYIYLISALCLASFPCLGQGQPVLNGVVKQAVNKETASVAKAFKLNKVKNLSSKELKAKFSLASQSFNMVQSFHQNAVSSLMLDNAISRAQKLAVLERLNQEDALIIKELGDNVTAAQARWSAALLRERNPNFLPKKDPQIPGLLAASPDLALYPDIEPQIFREWVCLIALYQETPEEFRALIIGLRQQFIQLGIKYRKMQENALKYKTELVKNGKPIPSVFYVSQRAKLSQEAAQCVADLVHLLNLYPSLYSSSLDFLADKLNELPQTPFTQSIREKIRLPNKEQPQKTEELTSPSRKVIRGFQRANEQQRAESVAAANSNPERKKVEGFNRNNN